MSLISCWIVVLVLPVMIAQACTPSESPSTTPTAPPAESTQPPNPIISVLDVFSFPNSVLFADPISNSAGDPLVESPNRPFALNGIACDTNRPNVYYLPTVDPINPRYYTLNIELDPTGFQSLIFTDVQNFRLQGGAIIMPDNSVQPRKIALNPDTPDMFFWTNEQALASVPGVAEAGDPSIHESLLETGAIIRNFNIPDAYLRATPDLGQRGVRNGRGLESLGVSTDRTLLVTAAQQPLLQDMEASDTQVGRTRILVFDIGSGEPVLELLYELGPIPTTEGDFNIVSLFDLAGVDDNTSLSLEVTQSAPGDSSSTRVEVYSFTSAGATNILPSTLANPGDPIPSTAVPVEKKLLLRLDEGDLPGGADLLRHTGFVFGPMIGDVRSLLFVSDSDDVGVPRTQFLVATFVV